MKKARLIAFYLPQFHVIPENDEWHGKGFTEWTNVTKAKPLFKGHYQPILPSELGFYDLRVPETRNAQAALAKEYGVGAFCYWHYWFGNGKRILERPFNDVLKTKEPDFPFCLAWANGSWTGIWYGMENKHLLEQEYLGRDDDTKHFYTVLEAFKDERYLRVDNKPLFVIYDPYRLPEAARFIKLWQELAKKEGLEGIYFVAASRSGLDEEFPEYDATTELDPFESPPRKHSFLDKLVMFFLRRDLYAIKRKIFGWPRRIIEYNDVIEYLDNKILNENEFPLITPNWDNTARSGEMGSVVINNNPKKFGIMLKNALEKIKNKKPDEKIIFVEAWNEWAEGNYLEPDQKFGRGFLEVIKENIIE